MKSADEVRTFFENATISTNPAGDKAVLADVLGAAGLTASRRPVLGGSGIWRRTMRSPIAKLAVAAAVILVCLGGFHLWRGTELGVALADVLAKVEQVRALTYQMDQHMKMTMPGVAPSEVDMKMTLLIADGYGMKLETSMPDPMTGQAMEEQAYILPEQKIMMRVKPAKKQYARVVLDGAMLDEKRKETNDPRTMIQRFLGCQYEDLGTSMLDGIEVQGFGSTDPALVGGSGDVDIKMWIDVKTRLPVRVDARIKVNDQVETRYTLHDFEWDVPVNAAEFTPVIPPDYTPGLDDGTKAAMATEQGAIEGLQFCVEFAGTYPKKIGLDGMMDLMRSFMSSQTPAAQKFRQEAEQAKSIEEQTAKTMEIARPIQSLTMFWIMLSQQKKEPAYYGDRVAPGDIAQVLLRWKTGDNEYRVIFADLHADTVTAEQLAQLEAALPK